MTFANGPSLAGPTIQALYSADPSFNFTRNMFDSIHKVARAIVDPENSGLSPLTPLSGASSFSASEARSSPLTPLSESPSPLAMDFPPVCHPALGHFSPSSPAKPLEYHETLTPACAGTLSFVTQPDFTPSPLTPFSVNAPNPPSSATPIPVSHKSRAAKRKAASKARSKENAKRKKNAQHAYASNPSLEDKQFRKAQPTQLSYSAATFPITSKGFTSRRAKKRTSSHYLDDFLGPKSKFNFGLRQWNGKEPMPLIDDESRVVGICAGIPKDSETWDDVQRRAAFLLETSRSRLDFDKKEKESRRGKFPASNVGISHGGGQPHPKILRHGDGNKVVLRELLDDWSFERISGFATGAFSTWAPRLYQYQSDCLTKIIEQDQRLRSENKHPRPDDEELQRNWPKTPWAAAAFNFGPQTICYPHADYGNLAFGWCSITALGDYDYRKGGHLVLWDLKLVVEFPPGSTIMIPSSAIHHSNTRIQRNEKRYSVTQYSAGGLFRWAYNGFMTAEKRQRSMAADDASMVLEELASQLEYGLSLYSTVDEIEKLRKISILKRQL